MPLPPRPPLDARELEWIKSRIQALDERVNDIEHRGDQTAANVDKLRGSLSDVPEHLRKLEEMIGEPPDPRTDFAGSGLTRLVLEQKRERHSDARALKARTDAEAFAASVRREKWESLARYVGLVVAAIAIFEALRRLLAGG